MYLPYNKHLPDPFNNDDVITKMQLDAHCFFMSQAIPSFQLQSLQRHHMTSDRNSLYCRKYTQNDEANVYIQSRTLCIHQVLDSFFEFGCIGTDNIGNLFTIMIKDKGWHGAYFSFSCYILLRDSVLPLLHIFQLRKYLQEQRQHRLWHRQCQCTALRTFQTWVRSTCKGLLLF